MKKNKAVMKKICNLAANFSEMTSEEEIIDGLRRGDTYYYRQYFYEYCRVAYQLFDKRYELSKKENLDFLSLAHQYAIYLMEHNWKPLEDRSPEVSLRTWMVNGFRYVVLDALKWYKREYGSITFEDYLQSFDLTSDLRRQFNQMLREGFKGKEIAVQLGMTPSAVSQRYRRLMDQVIAPYFRKHFDMNMDMPEVFDERAVVYGEMEAEADSGMMPMDAPTVYKDADNTLSMDINMDVDMEKKRTTPEYITELQPNEIFVFGSNLRGMHGGGAAYIAYRKFGAVMGQGVGLQGQSYAIPTMQGGVETIRPYVDEFIAFAREHPQLTFLVTRIGCGIAGFRDEEIAPLFSEAHEVENIVLPEGW